MFNLYFIWPPTCIDLNGHQGRIQEKMWPVSKRVSAEGASRLGGSGGMLPRKILKIWLSKTLFPAFSGLKINLGWEHGLKIKCSFHSPLLRCVQVPFSGDGVLQILQLPHPRQWPCHNERGATQVPLVEFATLYSSCTFWVFSMPIHSSHTRTLSQVE